MALRVAIGSYTGDGNDNRDITVSPSFAIKLVIIKNVGTIAMRGSISGMGDGAFPDSSSTLITNTIQSMGTGTFQVGSSSNSNGNGVTYRYFCIGGDDTEIKVGTYTGDGTDDRNITGIGFQPELVIVKLASGGSARIRFGTSGDESQFFSYTANAADTIQSFISDGFQVGQAINIDTGTYYYCAIKSVSGQTKVGTYTGDGNDNRDISGVGFLPELVLLKRSSASGNLVWTNTGRSDNTSNSGEEADITNAIQALQSDGFQVGTNANVNTNLATYYHYSIRDVQASGPANLKSYNTNLKANIKTINTNPIANVKSLNTNV